MAQHRFAVPSTHVHIWFANHLRAVCKPFSALVYTRLKKRSYFVEKTNFKLRPVHNCAVCHAVTIAFGLETAHGQIEYIEIYYDTHTNAVRLCTVCNYDTFSLRLGLLLNANGTQTRHAKTKPLFNINVLPRRSKQYLPIDIC